jgi:hypothetical protein
MALVERRGFFSYSDNGKGWVLNILVPVFLKWVKKCQVMIAGVRRDPARKAYTDVNLHLGTKWRSAVSTSGGRFPSIH